MVGEYGDLKMEIYMTETINMIGNVVMEFTCGLLVLYTKETSFAISVMALEVWNGKMETNMLEVGLKVKNMEKGSCILVNKCLYPRWWNSSRWFFWKRWVFEGHKAIKQNQFIIFTRATKL